MLAPNNRTKAVLIRENEALVNRNAVLEESNDRWAKDYRGAVDAISDEQAKCAGLRKAVVELENDLAKLRNDSESQLKLQIAHHEDYAKEAVNKHQRLLSQVELLNAQLAESSMTAVPFAEREPLTEVGYLRKELAYAQGQLHQSHLAVKQLCGRRSTPDSPVPADTDKKADVILDRISNLIERYEGLLADRLNHDDLAAANIHFPPLPEDYTKKLNQTIREYVADQPARGMCTQGPGIPSQSIRATT